MIFCSPPLFKSSREGSNSPVLRDLFWISYKLINYYNDAPVKIAGHTDSKGSDSYNQQLSENRADAVKDALATEFSIDSNRLNAKGFGESRPIAANTKSDGSDNPAGKQKNRRVEVVVKNKSGSSQQEFE